MRSRILSANPSKIYRWLGAGGNPQFSTYSLDDTSATERTVLDVTGTGILHSLALWIANYSPPNTYVYYIAIAVDGGSKVYCPANQTTDYGWFARSGMMPPIQLDIPFKSRIQVYLYYQVSSATYLKLVSMYSLASSVEPDELHLADGQYLSHSSYIYDGKFKTSGLQAAGVYHSSSTGGDETFLSLTGKGAVLGAWCTAKHATGNSGASLRCVIDGIDAARDWYGPNSGETAYCMLPIMRFSTSYTGIARWHESGQRCMAGAFYYLE